MVTTGTLKQRKVELQQEGFDPAAIVDPMFFRDDEAGTYVPLTEELARDLRLGKVRL
jgi:fatty-acyl-CoA synthase